MPRRLISAPGTTTDRWVYLLMYDVAVREVVVMATCFSKNAKGPQRPGDPPATGPTRLTYSCWTVPAGTFCRVLAERRFMFPIRHSGAAPMSDVLREQLVDEGLIAQAPLL